MNRDGRTPIPLRDRFEANHIPEPNSGCWLWLGNTTTRDYGTIWDNNKQRKEKAHRVAFELHVGRVPSGLVIDHLCRNHSCVNPRHLEPVTSGVNTRRGTSLILACPHGHKYTPENTMHEGAKRRCRTCRNREQRERNRASGKQLG